MNVITRIFASRKVWVALVGAAAVIAAQLGMDPAKADAISTAVMTLFSVVIGGIALEDAAEKRNPTNVAPPEEAK